MALFLLCPNLGWIQGQFNFTELSLRYHRHRTALPGFGVRHTVTPLSLMRIVVHPSVSSCEDAWVNRVSGRSRVALQRAYPGGKAGFESILHPTAIQRPLSCVQLGVMPLVVSSAHPLAPPREV